MTTEPDEVPPPSGLEPELADELELAAAGVDVLEELPLEQAVTAAMPTTARAAIPLLAEILMVIWIPSVRAFSLACLHQSAGRSTPINPEKTQVRVLPGLTVGSAPSMSPGYSASASVARSARHIPGRENVCVDRRARDAEDRVQVHG